MKTGFPPLDFVKLLENAYPNVWSTIDELRREAQKHFSWSDCCYIPPEMLMYFSQDLRKVSPSVAYSMSVCASWRRCKEIYQFDADMERLLLEQASDLDIPSEIIHQLPFPCIYVVSSLNQPSNHGFFAQIINTPGTDMYFLNLSVLFNSLEFFTYMIKLIPGETLHSGLDHYKKNGVLYDIYYQTASSAIQLLLYLCATNATITENPKQRKRKHRSSKGKTHDTVHEIRLWDVGVRIKKIKNAGPSPGIDSTANNTDDDSETIAAGEGHGRKRPRPHIRRSHWRHFWIGSKKDGTRKIVLRWVGMSVINGDLDEIPVIINQVTDGGKINQ